ncbi:hypothetical protein AGR1B_pa0150 [Agrobacterium fabacearum S56]|uniref:hypothetical protein n=1 Tax=Agrobacterium tumefaciens TaxID=358 RepID=UPI0009D01ED8|nr:hypothetical protein [Agrobacterium tumefaciens]CUX06906.1 hypothetical protein AGR1B_pa0150 [Agrobacterium fabacearum S56]
MPIRKIDDATALTVIDLQEGTRRFVGQAGPQVYVVAALLARTFRVRDLPVLLIMSEGGKMGRTDTSPDGGAFMFSTEAHSPFQNWSRRSPTLASGAEVGGV